MMTEDKLKEKQPTNVGEAGETEAVEQEDLDKVSGGYVIKEPVY